MPDRDVAAQAGQRRLVEDLGDQAEILVDDDAGAVADGDAGRLLAAVLQGVEAVVGELGDVLAGSPDAEHAALLPRWRLLRHVAHSTGRTGTGRCDAPRTAPRGSKGAAADRLGGCGRPRGPHGTSGRGPSPTSGSSALLRTAEANRSDRPARRWPGRPRRPRPGASPAGRRRAGSRSAGRSPPRSAGCPGCAAGRLTHCTAAYGGMRSSSDRPGARVASRSAQAWVTSRSAGRSSSTATRSGSERDRSSACTTISIARVSSQSAGLSGPRGPATARVAGGSATAAAARLALGVQAGEDVGRVAAGGAGQLPFEHLRARQRRRRRRSGRRPIGLSGLGSASTVCVARSDMARCWASSAIVQPGSTDGVRQADGGRPDSQAAISVGLGDHRPPGLPRVDPPGHSAA